MESNIKTENLNEVKMNINLSNEDIISEIITSDDFKKRLEAINANYSNLKQENLIRNYILEQLNEYFIENGWNNKKAFAEHPRDKGARVDLSIVDCNDIENPYNIEFKYQFSGDNKRMTKYHHVIKKDFEKRGSKLFVLIIAHWEKSYKREFDDKWGISSNLNKYISKTDDCKENIKNTLRTFKNSELIEFEKIQITKPFDIEYYFYVLKRI